MKAKHTAKKAHLITFGCQMNEYDSARIMQMLASLGYQAASQQAEADLILFNTCSVRAKAQSKLYSFLGELKDLKKQRPSAKLVVAGCVAQQEGRKLLKALPQVDLVLGTDALPDLPILLSMIEKGQRLVRTELSGQEDLPLNGSQPTLKAQVTVMRGCDNFCSYCVVPYVRGREVSRPAEAIVREVAALVAAGAKEVRLLGQNVNSYRDPSGLNFPGLLARVGAVEGLARIRCTTSHPKDLSPALIEAFATLPKLMPELHLPAQSGSNRILAAMNRGYSRERYLELVQGLRRRVPRLSLGGDIIVGFPGESEEDFSQTLDLLRQVQYDFLFSFKYSDRPLAPAAQLPGKLSEAEKNRRLLILQALQKEIGLKRNQELVGRIVEVLVEGPAKKGTNWLTGREPGGRAVNFPGPAGLQGELVQVKLMAAHINSLRGQRQGILPVASIQRV